VYRNTMLRYPITLRRRSPPEVERVVRASPLDSPELAWAAALFVMGGVWGGGALGKKPNRNSSSRSIRRGGGHNAT